MARKYQGPLLDDGDTGGREFFFNFPLSFEPDYIRFWDDFIGIAFDSTNDWTVVKDASASVSIAADTVGGRVSLTSQSTTDDNGSSIQGNEIFKPAGSKYIWFESTLQVSDADQMDAFVGLSENFTTNPEAVLSASNRIGFQIDDGNASILCKSEASDVETSKDSEVDASDATDVTLGFLVIGTNEIRFYADRTLVATMTTNIPTTELTPALMELSGNATGTKSMSVDYVMCFQDR